jgi:peptide deformylase
VIRPFIPWPDQRLRTPAEPVEAVTDEIREIWRDMVDTMVAMPGVGLAAPQIGVMLRLAVVDASGTGDSVVKLANPVLIDAWDDMREHEEASPNLPGVSAKLVRPARVKVRYLDESGAEVERGFEGLWSTSVQHQIDHLNGQMFFDRLSRTKRDMLLRRARKGRG